MCARTHVCLRKMERRSTENLIVSADWAEHGNEAKIGLSLTEYHMCVCVCVRANSGQCEGFFFSSRGGI